MFINLKRICPKIMLMLFMVSFITFSYGCSAQGNDSSSKDANSKQSSKVCLNGLDINNKIDEVTYNNKLAYIVPVKTTILKFSFNVLNANNIKFYQDNILIKNLDIKKSVVNTDVIINPKIASIKIVFSNYVDRVETNLDLHYSGVKLSDREKIIAVSNDGSYSNFLVGTQSVDSMAKFNYNYIYRENIHNSIIKKIVFPEQLLGNAPDFKSLGNYILTSIPTNKSYNTPLVKALLYNVNNKGEFSLIDSNVLNNNSLKVKFKENNLEITRENKSISVPLKDLNRGFQSSLTDQAKQSFKIRGLDAVNIYEKDNVTYLSSSYSIYNEDIMPVLDLINLTVDYKIDGNQLSFVKMESKVTDSINTIQ